MLRYCFRKHGVIHVFHAYTNGGDTIIMHTYSRRCSKAFLLLLTVVLLAQFFLMTEIPACAASDSQVHYMSSEEDLQEGETEEDYQASGSSGSIKWSLSDHVLTISGSGKMPNYASEQAPWYSYRHAIKAVVIRSGVTHVGSYAFKHVPMYAISIPASVKSLGYKSFAYTDRLKSVYYGGKKTKWSKVKIGFGNSLLRTSTVHYVKSAKSAAALAKKNGLKQSTPKKSLRWSVSGTTLTISGSGSMQDYVSDPVATAPWHARYANVITRVVITGGVTSIGNYAFYDFTRLSSISLASTVKQIGVRAFYRCTSLKAIALPNTVTTIRKNAFQNCYNLTAAVLPRGLKTISSYCFNQCSNLRVVTIPASVTSIEKEAFWHCYKLSKVNYKGSQSQWKKVTVKTGNQKIKNAQKVYNYAH